MSFFLRVGASDGVVDLIENQESGHVEFTKPRPRLPASIRLTIAEPNTMRIFATVIQNSVTLNGFDFELSAQMPAGGGQLNYSCEN